MLTGTKSDTQQPIGQFAERLFHQVAQQHRQSLKSLGGEKALQAALESRVKLVVMTSDPERIEYPEAVGIVCGIALNLFEHSTKSGDRWVAQKATSTMASFEIQRGSLESGAALLERLLTIKPLEPEDGFAKLEYFVDQYRQSIYTLDILAGLYRSLDWPAKSAKALRTIIGEVYRYLGLPSEFLAATEIGVAADVFERWKVANPKIPIALSTWSVEMVVSAYLQLSELALAGYHPKQAEGDESMTASSFYIVSYPVSGDAMNAQEPVELPEATSELLITLAYAQDGVLGEGEAEKRHVWLLERLGRQAIDRKQYDAADEYLQRALKIAGSLKDEMFQLSVLNNLIATFGQKGDLERTTKFLEVAAPICDSYIHEPTFPVDIIMEDSGPDGRPVAVERIRVDPERDQKSSPEESTGSRWIRRAHVPVRFSKEFDANPDEVLARDRTMMSVIASVFGNAGHRALAKNEASKAKQNFSTALSIHEEIGDPAGAFHDLERMARIAHIEGKREEVCANLRRCLALAPALQKIDSRRWKNVERDTRDAMREAGCTDEEPPVASTVPEPKQAPSSDHPLQS
jgi:tetratricopeptide (TPR) repeat protein